MNSPFSHNLSAQSRPRLLGVGLLTLCIAIATPVAAWGDLTPAQKSKLDAVRSGLKQLQTNLKLAQDAAGPGTGRPKGSKAKLAMMRLQSAKAPIPQLQKALGTLPAADPEVQKTQKNLDVAIAAANALETRLTGQAPAPAGGGAAEAGVKLDYRQEEQLKNARFSLRDLQGRAAVLTQLVEELKQAEDQRLIDHRKVQTGINTLEVADRRTKETRDSLAPLPSDGRGVATTQSELDQAVASVAASREFLVPLHQKLAQLINPGSYPTLDADIKRLGELAGMFANRNILVENRAQATEVIRTAPAAVEERDRIVKQYAILTHQQTPEGKRIVGISNHFTQQYFEFAAAAKQQKEGLPKEITGHLDEARKWASEAVAEKKPLFFTGGIPQTLGFAEEKIALLQTLDAAAAATMTDKLKQTRAELKKAQDSLRESIIAANELPQDRYAHSDRPALEKLAADAWKQREPNAEVLATRIPSAEWKRSVMWRNQTGSWYKVDHSKLQVQLIVKHDAKLAVIRPINLWKDHLSNDEIKAFPFHEEGAELQPHNFLLLEKAK